MRQECVEAISKATGKPFTSEQGDLLIGLLKAKMATMKRSEEYGGRWEAMSHDERIQAAGVEIAKDMRAEAERRKGNIYKTILLQDKNTRELARLAKDEDIHAYAGVAKVLQNTYAYAQGVRNEFLTGMLDTMSGIRTKWLGFVENKQDVIDFVKEAFGEDSGNQAAKQAWMAWSDTAEKMRQRAVRAGAEIGKLDYGYIPQSHDWLKVRKAGIEEWVNDVLPRLDKSRYLDEYGNQMTDVDIAEQVLEPAWRDIVTSGNPVDNIFEIKKRVENHANGHAEGGSRSSEHRVLHFKDADSFMTYENKYGRGSLTSSLIGHVSKMSNDIAIMETLGPQPGATFRMMKSIAESEALNARISESQWKLLTGYSDAMGLSRVSIDAMYDTLIGKTSYAALNRECVARFMSGFRNIEVAGRLGKAFISSLSDIPTYFITTGFNRLPFFQSAEFLAKAYGKDWKDYANRIGFISDSIAADFSRWANDNIGQGWTSKLANATMKVSFLTAYTDAVRRAFSLNMMAGLGKMIKKSWGELDDFDRARLTDGGITETDWNLMRLAGTETYKGIEFLSMEKMKNLGKVEGVADSDVLNLPSKVIGFVVKESEMASMNPDLVTRAETTRGTQKGTIGGEVARSLFLFKSFPLAMMEKHWRRAMFLQQHAGNAQMGLYLAEMAIWTTVFGAISLQVQNALNGKDLQDVSDSQFWLGAMAKGGGLGFLGDYLAYGIGEDSMYGSMSGAANILGPVAGSIIGASDVMLSATKNAIYDKKTKPGAKATRFLRQHMPFVNTWYAATAIDRWVMDDLQEILSPGYNRAKMSRQKRGTGQGYWWKPGEALPERGIEMADKPKK